MKLQVITYDKHQNYHVCLDKKGHKHRIDLMVDGGFPDSFDPKDLEGKEVEVHRLTPFIEIAHDVCVNPES